jgi:hypothetical protein
MHRLEVRGFVVSYFRVLTNGGVVAAVVLNSRAPAVGNMHRPVFVALVVTQVLSPCVVTVPVDSSLALAVVGPPVAAVRVSLLPVPDWISAAAVEGPVVKVSWLATDRICAVVVIAPVVRVSLLMALDWISAVVVVAPVVRVSLLMALDWTVAEAVASSTAVLVVLPVMVSLLPVPDWTVAEAVASSTAVLVVLPVRVREASAETTLTRFGEVSSASVVPVRVRVVEEVMSTAPVAVTPTRPVLMGAVDEAAVKVA